MRTRHRALLLDLLIFGLLAVAAFPMFLRGAHGDLWLDEVDYSLASLQGVSANRWDTGTKPDQTEQLIRLRHFHAPATAILINFAHHYGSEETTLRTPFIVAGCLSVGVVYLCGICLFSGRRHIAAACAALTILTPANIRMASHAVPWSPIILELLLILLSLLWFASTHRGHALVLLGVAMGALFVTSEMFFVAMAASVLCLVAIFVPDIMRWRRRIAGAEPTINHTSLLEWKIGAISGLCVAVGIALIVWPAGLKGGAFRMLHHYVEMRHSESFPVNIGSHVYKIAPRWAYIYWYLFDFRPYFAIYVAGTVASIRLGIKWLSGLRSLSSAGAQAAAENGTLTVVLLVFETILLAAAHRAHIIGAEYLAHCLPFLGLMAGNVLLLLDGKVRWLGVTSAVLVGAFLLQWRPAKPLPGMDYRSQLSRWPAASAAIKARWIQPDRLILGPQSYNTAYWYLHEYQSMPIFDWQVGQFSLAGPGPNFLHNLSIGKYRYVVVSSQFEDNVIKAVDERSMEVLSKWEGMYVSDERGSGPPRLTVFRFPGAQYVPPSASGTSSNTNHQAP